MRGNGLNLLLCLTALCVGCSSNNNSDSGSSSSSGSGSSSGTAITRPVNSSCTAANFQTGTDIQLTRIFPGLSFSNPVLLLQQSGQSRYWHVVEQGGGIYRIDSNNSTASAVMDISSQINLAGCGECGLLGMAFHPDFSSNGYIYLSFTENRGSSMYSVVARFTSNDGGATLDPASRSNIFEVQQPYSNHNGGNIAFGPDGYLYLGLGDGGSGDDPENNGQTTTTPLGAMLRMQDDGSPAPGNNVSGNALIFAYGLRNPWRWSFDRTSGELWAGDVGQNAYEEVDIIQSGGNYGWRCYEGFHQTGNSCSSSGPYIEPVTEYDHSEGYSITGGYVYRGNTLPALRGVYIFGDYGSGQIWGLFSNGNSYDRTPLLNSGMNISSFAEDNNGELYVVSYGGGLYRVDADISGSSVNEPPRTLSETGCANAVNPAEPATGLIAYDIIEPFWSDGVVKQRYLALPDNTTIDINNDGDLNFPIGTVLMKYFYFQDRLIETRLFMLQSDDVWRGYSYQWNNTQTEATLLADALDDDIGGQTWHYPGRTECNQCHTPAAGFALGPELLQLNRDFTGPDDGITANQINRWEQMGLFSNAVTADLRNEALTGSHDNNADLQSRARSYLHTNCSSCHRPGGPTPVNLDLRYRTALADTGACDTVPQAGNLGINNARIIAPGDANRSVLLQRINTMDAASMMPPLARNVIDDEGVALIQNWINSLSGCE